MAVTDTVSLVPQLRHRLAMALEHADLGVSEMADKLGVGRNTISNYIHGRTVPNRATLHFWASATGVDFAWLVGEEGGDAVIGMVSLWESDYSRSYDVPLWDNNRETLEICAA